MHRVYQALRSFSKTNYPPFWIRQITNKECFGITTGDGFDAVRIIPLIFAAVLWTVSGCHQEPTGSSMDRTQAKAVSDSYMADLVADRVDLAVDGMEAQFIQSAGGNAKAGAQPRVLFDYCGRPLESELSREETGIFVYGDGHRAPMRAFYYSGRTTQQPKGVCLFAVRVVPGENGIKVVNFGPLK
jgi:hypothetical protein